MIFGGRPFGDSVEFCEQCDATGWLPIEYLGHYFLSEIEDEDDLLCMVEVANPTNVLALPSPKKKVCGACEGLGYVTMEDGDEST